MGQVGIFRNPYKVKKILGRSDCTCSYLYATLACWLLLQNVELMASLREQIKVQGLANQICSQGIIEGGHDSSQVEESSLLSTSQQVMNAVCMSASGISDQMSSVN